MRSARSWRACRMRGSPTERFSRHRSRTDRLTWTISSSGWRRRTRSSRRRSVQDHCSYDYAVIRVVPRVDREEFVNAGVIVSCAARGVLEARIDLDPARLLALDSSVDLDVVRAQLASIPIICAGGPEAGPIGKLS